MRSDPAKVVVGSEQRQFVTDAELREQRIDRADLQAGTTAAVTQVRRVDVILADRREERERRKPVDNVFPGTRAGKSL